MYENIDRRAVSEAVGYITVVGLILTTISLAYFNGVPALENTKQNQRLESVETAFSVLKTNLNELSVGGATKRRTQIRLSGGKIGIQPNSNTWIRMSVRNETGAEVCGSICNTSVDPIVYEGPESIEFIYETGALVRTSGERSGMIGQPNWVIQKEGVIVRAVGTRGQGSVAGDDLFSVRSSQAASESIVRTENGSKPGGLNVTITVRTDYPTAWSTFPNSSNVDSVVDDVSFVPIGNPLKDPRGYVKMYINNTPRAVYSKTIVDTSVSG